MPTYTSASQYHTGSLSLVAGAQAYAVYFTQPSLKYKEDAQTNSPQGDLYQLSLSGNVPKDRPLTAQLRLRLMNERCTLVFQDWNSYWRIYRRMRSKPSAFSGAPGGYNGTTLNFTGQSARPAGFWQFVAGVGIATDHPTCPGETGGSFMIGDPEADQVIGDPVADQVIGWMS